MSIDTDSIHDLAEEGPEAVRRYNMRRIRTFCILAHIDHGKSTLADRLLEITGNIKPLASDEAQMLDTLQVERERGITVKAQTASMLYSHVNNKGEYSKYLLNLIDTPGHIDFTNEVTRSLSSCNGVLMLVDSVQGIQAQTLATFNAARDMGLAIIPVITKIDLPNARPDEATLQACIAFDLEPEDVLLISAKTGEGVGEILPAIISRIPAPRPSTWAQCYYDSKVLKEMQRNRSETTEEDINQVPYSAPCRARVVDSWFDSHRGVISLIQVIDGVLLENERITTCLLDGRESFTVQELGFLTPRMVRCRALFPGQVGYMCAGMRSTRQALLGDTITHWPPRTRHFLERKQIQNIASGESNRCSDVNQASPTLPPALSGFSVSKPMLFATLYPFDTGDFDELRGAVEKLVLNDCSVTVEPEASSVLGNGLKCGFLGVLHMEVFHQRLKDEYDTPVILTTPQVPYIVIDNTKIGDDVRHRTITSLDDWPLDEQRGGK